MDLDEHNFYTYFSGGANARMGRDAESSSQLNAGSSNPVTPFSIGFPGSGSMKGLIMEWTFYTSNQEANKAAIFADMDADFE